MARRRKSFAFRFHEILRYSHDDKVFGLRPKRKPIRSVLINGLCLFEVSVRKANAEISAELMSHTSPFCNDYNKLQSVAFLVFVFLFPTRQKLRFHLSFHTQVRLFLTCGSPCVCSTRMRGTVLRKPPRRRSGIIRERYLSMRVPTSPLRAMCG